MLPGILIMMPLMMMGLFPWAANMEMRNINVTVWTTITAAIRRG